MATIVLSAVGFAAGQAVGGSVLGLSSAVIGRAIGATIGRVIDQKLLGQGSDPVEHGKVDRFRLSGASEGALVAQMHGRGRVSGQVIWATEFLETATTSGGGKGGPPKPKVTEYSYSVSLAVALCRGEISGVGRIWADGRELAADEISLRVYHGAEDQLPDPKIEAVEGAGMAPAYRGTAYVVIEDLELGPFGNRVPQFSFEVFRPAPSGLPGVVDDPSRAVKAVALIPGTGEYALATTPVHFEIGPGENRSANVNSPVGKPDLLVSLDGLKAELPNCGSVSLVVSWFGDDLRCGACEIKPKVEQKLQDGAGMPWVVSGLGRSGATDVPKGAEDRPLYGGTPTDRSVIEAIQACKAAGQDVVFYPFILMTQQAENGLTDPWTGDADQPEFPWRGRITLSVAPGEPGSPDQSAVADAQVAAFFGSAATGDYSQTADGVDYSGPAEWSFRRFILHYANLCAVAGGVDAFCIGSEMRGLTQIRGASGFPAVAALRVLAGEVRSILGAGCKIGYAADWSEYFGYHPQDGSGDVYFNLDPLWADADIDFVGIDNYMPLSDWRDGDAHADAGWGSVYNLDYLTGNIEGGEGYDWYYSDGAAREYQVRTPITDGAHGEPWVFRYKDLRNWWTNAHHERIGGVRQGSPTVWVPESKPIYFTEYGCGAVEYGTNQPNKFLDPKSSESSLPYHSSGRRDDFVQMQYLRAMTSYYASVANNPVSSVYGQRMVDMSRAHVWAWDTRPYPSFPARDELWSDGENYLRGHWLNGRASARSLAGLVAEVCLAAGVTDYDVEKLYGLVRGYAGDAETGRAALQPLMLAYAFDALEREGKLIFRCRDGRAVAAVAAEGLAVSPEAETDLALVRAPGAETSGRLRLSFIEEGADYETRAEEAVHPDEATQSVAGSELPLVLTRTEARGIVERWLAEARVARDTAAFALPLSQMSLGAGDVVSLPGEAASYRIDRVELAEFQMIEAVRVEPKLYTPSDAVELGPRARPYVAPVPVYPLFLDLPLLRGDEVPHAPYVAAAARPWPGSVAVYDSSADEGYELNRVLSSAAVIGTTETVMAAAEPGVLDRSAALRVKLVSGVLASASLAEVLNGANVAAIGDGTPGNWEVFQFADAELVDERTYELSSRLRGQAGTDGVMPASWPAGSIYVLLNGSAQQIDLALSKRGLARHYRIGPARRGYDHPSYTHVVEAFDGIGLRPYAPVHLRWVRDGSGNDVVSWVRRTRVDGDSWQSTEVPLGEESESYLVRVIEGGSVVREVSVSAPSHSYSAAARSADGVSGSYQLDVAQVSARFGPGPFRRIVIDG
ncbi:glycoside hydrolase/phage tail family protein [Pseudoruegeria sp. HB172150]|uniref:baseplate multidomain protein megatron n=1 Tax=Pseudoruegeria sp. HB172150 TaxID=2721164 RepID=UPI001554E097|nr:glycoside hydrolase/phage tail family protein [Pseudoruegeria sp. HB172150]